jgi:hypothetical protein
MNKKNINIFQNIWKNQNTNIPLHTQITQDTVFIT